MSDNKSEAGPQSEQQSEPSNRCARCLTHPPSFALCRGAFAYATPIDQLIADYKFNERLDVGAGLSEELGLVMEAYYAGVRQEASTRGKPCAVIAVPLHPPTV
ncbi:hypothetical protein N9C14_00190 [Gammaproteobacteria bacterium]|nr:hypothetical protein [Gammaproteobacteria bacterium]MDB2376440.1 hypothetical protein [Gammaproteobacteria bacterium]MDC3361382.1 hypothetical protein [Gammaproteobacteria bacterium]